MGRCKRKKQQERHGEERKIKINGRMTSLKHDSKVLFINISQ